MKALDKNQICGRSMRAGVLAGVLAALTMLPWRSAQAQAPLPPDPIVDETFSIRQNEELLQLEEISTLLARSLSKVTGKVNQLAVHSLHFGGSLDADFRHKAEVLILEKMSQANSTVQLVQCQECSRLETRIVKGVLKVRKGLATNEARVALAKKLKVDGFIDIGLFRENNQMSVYVKVIDAQSGEIILVDEQVGRRIPERDSFTLSLGEMTFPLTNSSGMSVSHQGLVLGFNETVLLTSRFSFGADLNLYIDNNANDPDAFAVLVPGFLLMPQLGFDMLQFTGSASRVTLLMGVGKLLAPQFKYATVLKAGLQIVVGDSLTFSYVNLSYTKNHLANDNILQGSGHELLFGYRF